MLRQDEDPDGRPVLRADRLGGPETLIGVRRWHPDVDDHHVRQVFSSCAQKTIRVVDLRDDIESCVDEEARDALPDEHRIVGEDKPNRHRWSTRARIAAPETFSLGMKPNQSPLVRRRP